MVKETHRIYKTGFCPQIYYTLTVHTQCSQQIRIRTQDLPFPSLTLFYTFLSGSEPRTTQSQAKHLFSESQPLNALCVMKQNITILYTCKHYTQKNRCKKYIKVISPCCNKSFLSRPENVICLLLLVLLLHKYYKVICAPLSTNVCVCMCRLVVNKVIYKVAAHFAN